MDALKLDIPHFLFAENPIKLNDKIKDNRTFIYCSQFLSLVEVIPEDVFLASYPKENFQKRFFYKNESFLLVFIQNNIKSINSLKEIELIKKGLPEMTPEVLIKQAWDFYEKYLIWEDSQ